MKRGKVFILLLVFAISAMKAVSADCDGDCPGSFNPYFNQVWQGVSIDGYEDYSWVALYSAKECNDIYEVKLSGTGRFYPPWVIPSDPIVDVINAAIESYLKVADQKLGISDPTQSFYIDLYLPTCWETTESSINPCNEDNCCKIRYKMIRPADKEFCMIETITPITPFPLVNCEIIPGSGGDCEYICSAHILPIGEVLGVDDGCDSKCYWRIDGNSNTTEENFIGTAQGNWNPLIFKTQGIQRMIINELGKISVGDNQITPSIHSDYLMAVNGKFVSKEIIVTIDEDFWGDYIFNENYQLMPIKQVAEYIKINGHLPGIPSAEEIGKNGINIGIMQANLVKKIEELTLYMIKLQKDNEELNKRIQELEINTK